MILKNSTVALGDTLNTFPTVASIIRYAQVDKLYWSNADVGGLFPKSYNVPQIFEIPSNAHVIDVNYHDYIHGRLENRGNFTTSVLYKAFGTAVNFVDIEDKPVKLEIIDDDSVPVVDFILAPYVLNNPAKNLPPQFWQSLIDALKVKYNCTIMVIGKSRLPSDEDLYKIENNIERFKEPLYYHDNFTKHFKNVEYFWDQPLTRVASLLKKVKYCMVSPDSGPSHLMAMIGRPHIELFNEWLGLNCILVRNVFNPLRINLSGPVTLNLVVNEIDKLVLNVS